MSNITAEAFMSKMSVMLDVDYSDEQIDFLKDMTKPQICFASPGTGKTSTAVAGLLMTELFHKIPGENIYALSFTRAATAELKVRHKRACDKLRLPTQTVGFMTLHALCNKLLRDNAKRLGIVDLSTAEPMSMQSAASLIMSCCSEWGTPIKENNIRSIVNAIRNMNSSLIFSREHVESTLLFKETELDYTLFNKIRAMLFQYNLLSETIQVNDIMLYTLYLLNENPDIEAFMKSKIRVMLVDEAQDLSLLQLMLICKMTDNPILIGDMKQQIYGFNGACQEIVQRYLEIHPDATKLYLTRTYRCKTEITDYAAKLIEPNMLDERDECNGTGIGGTIHVTNELNLANICDALQKNFIENRHMFYRETMFLFRNNSSCVPVVEELYKRDLPFLVNKYQPAFAIPVMKELCELMELCRNPQAPSNAKALRYLIPEMNAYSGANMNPIEKICMKTGCDIFSVNYQFRNGEEAAKAMTVLMHVRELMHKGAFVSELVNKLWPLYDKVWLSTRAWMLEYPVDYYINLVDVIVRSKTFEQFQRDEIDKVKKSKEYELHRMGVCCYTMHAAKGLEADDVYILDAEAAIIPNVKSIARSVKKGSALDAAREIRNERSLCYVAVTRARENVVIQYKKEPSPLLLGENPYTDLDELYATYETNEDDDVRAFNEFCKEIM